MPLGSRTSQLGEHLDLHIYTCTVPVALPLDTLEGNWKPYRSSQTTHLPYPALPCPPHDARTQRVPCARTSCAWPPCCAIPWFWPETLEQPRRRRLTVGQHERSS